jgi:hypothetical protein
MVVWNTTVSAQLSCYRYLPWYQWTHSTVRSWFSLIYALLEIVQWVFATVKWRNSVLPSLGTAALVLIKPPCRTLHSCITSHCACVTIVNCVTKTEVFFAAQLINIKYTTSNHLLSKPLLLGVPRRRSSCTQFTLSQAILLHPCQTVSRTFRHFYKYKVTLHL